MRRLIITTVVLFIAVIAITVAYFKNLNSPGLHATETLRYIPDNAPMVFEFNNDDGFYDIFTDNKLFATTIGQQHITDLDTIRHQLLGAPQLKPFFKGQNLFISLHPVKNQVELLVTIAASKGLSTADIAKLQNQSNKKLLVTPAVFTGKKGFTVYSSDLRKRFYLVNKAEGIYAGSFSKELIEHTANYIAHKDKDNFLTLPDKQNSNSLANLYVNYERLNPLFDVLFKNKNTELFKSFKLLPALAVLSLNFKSDALLFTGFSNLQTAHPAAYLNLFANQQPVENRLKELFPSTTAYSMSFAVSDIKKFKADLSDWHVRTKTQHEKDSLFARVKTETGVNLIAEFNQALSHEFAAVTTRFMERYAIISLKDGAAFKPVMVNISTMATENIGQINYNKLPFFLLGDAFNGFKHPYFMIVDNYLILANTESELKSYYDTYTNHKFQSKQQQYNQFENLMAMRSNVAWYINFKNAQPILKRDLNNSFYTNFERAETGWNNFYAACFQLSGADKNFYTSFCMNLKLTDNATDNPTNSQ